MSGSQFIPTTENGAEIEKKSFIWRIKNFQVIRKRDSIINSQHLAITAGDKIGQPSKWKIFLKTETSYLRKWIGIYYGLTEGPETGEDFLFSQCSFAIKDRRVGKTIWRAETDVKSIEHMSKLGGRGFRRMLPVSGIKSRECLDIHITLTLHGPTNPNCQIKQTVQVEELLARAQHDFTSKVGKDLGILLQNPMPGDVKVMSSDRKKEFLVPRGILAVRSPVLEAMLKCNMSEAKEGVIHLSDLSDKSLDVLINFIYTGELLPNWKEGEVVVELTNAAAQYQFLDLLEFLDKAVGKVCVVENALPLFTLATQLQLKTAEEELVKFVREHGVNSVETLCEILGST